MVRGAGIWRESEGIVPKNSNENEHKSMSATATDQRVFNFSAGPAALPLPVLRQIQEEMVCFPGAGASVMELSHRGQVFTDIINDAESTIRSLLEYF